MFQSPGKCTQGAWQQWLYSLSVDRGHIQSYADQNNMLYLIYSKSLNRENRS